MEFDETNVRKKIDDKVTMSQCEKEVSGDTGDQG